MPSASHAAFSSPGSVTWDFSGGDGSRPPECSVFLHLGRVLAAPAPLIWDGTPPPSTVSWSVPQQPVVAGFREVKERCGVLNVKFPGFGGLRWETEGFMGMGGRG